MSKAVALLAIALSFAAALPRSGSAQAQNLSNPSNKTEFAIELHDIDNDLRDLLNATRADHGACLACYDRLDRQSERWAAYPLAIDNARRWARQADSVHNPDELDRAHRALANALLFSFSAKGKEKAKEANEAVALYAAILERTPSDLQIRFDSGRSLAYARRPNEAHDQFARFLQDAPPDDPRITPARRFMAEPSLAAHRLIPDIPIKLSSGREISTGHLLGTRYIIDIWASWCPSCIGSMPEIRSLLADYRKTGLGSLGISVDGKRSSWENALKKYKPLGGQALDEDGSIRSKLQTSTIPRFIFVDTNGVVLYEGYKMKELRAAVEAELGPPPAGAPVAASGSH